LGIPVDVYPLQRAADTGEPCRPFKVATDYKLYVNGKPRFDGPRDFFASRGIRLSERTPWLTAFDGLKPLADTHAGLVMLTTFGKQ
jgi:hypothetical protein